MRILVLSMLAASLIPAQTAETKAVEKVPSEKAPPEVDKALRARVSQFYQAHVDAKYRLADQVVAEDSKDLYFAAAKPKYDSFEIIRVAYYDNFTKADAVVATKGTWVIRGNRMPVTMPSTTTWKLENGLWCWYIIPSKESETPFGTMHFDNKGPDSAGGAVAALPGDPKVLAQQILSAIKVDREELRLSSYEPSSGEIKVFNGMQGAVTLRADIDGAFPGLKYEFDNKTPGAGQTAVLTVNCTPKDRVAKPTLTLRIFVEPTNHVIPVTLTFAVPPEIEKLLPKQAPRPKPER